MPHLSVQENVAFGLRERRVPAGQIRERLAAGLTLVGGGRPVRASAARAKGQRLFPLGAAAMIAFDPADVTMIPEEDW